MKKREILGLGYYELILIIIQFLCFVYFSIQSVLLNSYRRIFEWWAESLSEDISRNVVSDENVNLTLDALMNMMSASVGVLESFLIFNSIFTFLLLISLLVLGAKLKSKKISDKA